MKAAARFTSLLRAGLAALTLAAALAGCQRQDDGTLQRLLDLESYGFKGQKPSLDTVEGLKKAIAENKAEVEKKVKANQNLGAYYKMLALKYIDNEMYGQALDALSNAIQIYPENPILFYYAAASSARLAKADVTDAKQMALLLSQAESYYKRAIFLDPTYVNAMYGLAVLYAVELGRPEDAEPLLKDVLDRQKKNIDAMFLLARVYYQRARPEDAIDMYTKIIDTNPPLVIKNQAEANKKQIEEELYGRGK